MFSCSTAKPSIPRDKTRKITFQFAKIIFIWLVIYKIEIDFPTASFEHEQNIILYVIVLFNFQFNHLT